MKTSLLRNIGIISHINSGKTTTSERILYYSGKTSTSGDVDKGNTITDYLSQERDRGITITSSAVSYNWQKHKINLIDTPGHVDFTVEVERSLAVLDGAVTLLDASAGVEAQTMTVWNQALKYRLPNIVFLNKYDKPKADYNMCISQLKSCFRINPALTQLPVIKKTKFTSIIDVINRSLVDYEKTEKDLKFIKLDLNDAKLERQYLDNSEECREKLINQLSDLDDEFSDHVLECSTIRDVHAAKIQESVRRQTIARQISPVLLGSSFRHVGVHGLMDAIVSYLPSPAERRLILYELLDHKVTKESKRFFGFVFKILHDKYHGPLTYVKICNASLSTKCKNLYNYETGQQEQIKKIYEPFADELIELKREVQKDDIVIIVGPQECKTGDILVEALSSSHCTKIRPNEKLPFSFIDDVLVPDFKSMDSVYYCSIEGPTVAQQQKFESVLCRMAREDPSFTYDTDETGYTTIRGMGKLHLQIIRDRIHTEYDIDSTLGPIQIAYRETVRAKSSFSLEVNKTINGVKNIMSIELEVKPKKNTGRWISKQLKVDSSRESEVTNVRQDYKKAIERGIEIALNSGPLLQFPIVDCEVKLMKFSTGGRCSYPVISSGASQCITKALKKSQVTLLEPIMVVELVVPKEKNGAVLADIKFRRGSVTSTIAQDNLVYIKSRIPLSEMDDYSEYLRLITSGMGTFTMTLDGYAEMSDVDVSKVIRSQ